MKEIVVLFVSIFLIEGFANAQTATTKDDLVLETLGSSTGLLMYQSYMCVGAIADAFGANGYEKETVVHLMAEQKGSYQSIAAQYQKLLESDFFTDENDKQFVRDFIMTMGFIESEAITLSEYASNTNDVTLAEYQLWRKKSWDMIAELLDIK